MDRVPVESSQRENKRYRNTRNGGSGNTYRCDRNDGHGLDSIDPFTARTDSVSEEFGFNNVTHISTRGGRPLPVVAISDLPMLLVGPQIDVWIGIPFTPVRTPDLCFPIGIKAGRILIGSTDGIYRFYGSNP